MTATHHTGRRTRKQGHHGTVVIHAVCRPTVDRSRVAGSGDAPNETASGRHPETTVDAFCGSGPVTDAMVRAALEDMLRRCGFTTPPEAGFGVRGTALGRCAVRPLRAPLWPQALPPASPRTPPFDTANANR